MLTEGEDGERDGAEALQEETTLAGADVSLTEPEPAEAVVEAVAPSGNILDWTEGDA